jgi:23S rRNA pseudouridine1911/1915/1917 synthase
LSKNTGVTKISNSIKINILYEDNHLLVVEKPVNILSQGDITGDRDLLTILKEDIKVRYNKPGKVYLGLVHRLDRPVGGVMVFARTSKAASRLSEQVRNRTFKKEYLAVVHGKPEPGEGHLEHYLLKDEKTNVVKVVSDDTDGKPGKKAVLEYKVISSRENLSLVKVSLLTGRNHQIRVQFSTIGNPLYGDQKYGVKYARAGQQIALWSNRITIQHPVGKQEMIFQSNPPDEYPWNLFFA